MVGGLGSSSPEAEAVCTHRLQIVTAETYIYNRANSRLHFPLQLKRAAVSCKDMLRFYIAVIRPVLEYAAAVWHTGLTAELA